MKKVYFILFVLVLLVMVLGVTANEQVEYTELPPGFSYFICWDASEPVMHVNPWGGESFAECPLVQTPSYLPLVSGN